MNPRSTLLMVLLALTVSMAAGQQGAGPSRAAPAGVLIGLVPAGDNTAAGQEETSPEPEPAPNQGPVVIKHSNQSEAQNPLQTIWIQVVDGQVRVRLMQDLIVPRKNGFWRVGLNVDSASGGGGNMDEAFFWAAPLGEKPKLGMIHDEDVGCVEQSVSRSLDYVGPDYYAYTEFWTATCAHYDEGHHYGFMSLDDPNGNGVSVTKIFGPAATQQLALLNRQARRWESDCGQAGFEGSETEWTVKHSQGQWQAFFKFNGTGGGICGRYDEDRKVKAPLPRFLAAANSLPVKWQQLKTAFPEATDAFASPNGALVLIFVPGKVLAVPFAGGALQKPLRVVDIPNGQPVMAEWASGPNVARWDKILQPLPAPRPAAPAP